MKLGKLQLDLNTGDTYLSADTERFHTCVEFRLVRMMLL